MPSSQSIKDGLIKVGVRALTFKEEMTQISGIWLDGTEREHALASLRTQAEQIKDFKTRWWAEKEKVWQVQYLIQGLSCGDSPLDVIEAIKKAIRNTP